MLRPSFTTFDRSAIPTNLLTVADWRTFAANAYPRLGWMGAARRYAAQTGGALILRADDRLVCLTRLESGKLRQTTYRPGTWGWAS